MLKALKIQNFTCFPEAELTFSKSLNVIVGENGTGKTHLLKLGYAALYIASQVEVTDGEKEKEVRLRNSLNGIFKSSSINKFFSFHPGKGRNCSMSIDLDEKEQLGFNFNVDRQLSESDIFSASDIFAVNDVFNDSLNSFDDFYLNVKQKTLSPIFIPAKELLSIYPGLAYEIENKLLAFDDTYLHLSKALSAPELRGDALKAIEKYAQSVEQITSSVCIKYDDKFLLVPFKIEKGKFTEYPKIEAHLAAEGARKIGMLSYLMRNGTLRPGASLFWDEPEANLNPKLIKKLAAVLVELSEIMQITIATHSLFLLRELEIYAENRKLSNVRYFGLHLTKDGVKVMSGDSSDDVGEIAVLDASVAQSEEYMNLQYAR